MFRKPAFIRLVMLFTLLLIGGFQVYWLYSTWNTERRMLLKETSMLLRETVFEMQIAQLPAEMLHGDSLTLKPGGKVEVQVTETHSDTLAQGTVKADTRIIAVQPLAMHGMPVMPRGGMHFRSTDMRMHHWGGGAAMGLLGGRISPDTLTAAFQARLDAGKYPFTAVVYTGTDAENLIPESVSLRTLPVPLAWESSEYAAYELKGSRLYLLGRILPQIAFSLFMMSLLGLTLWLLWRNFRTQQRIAAQQRQFISNMSHELKTPIATVSVALEALGSFHALQDAQRTREYLAISRQELNRLGLMVDKVLRLSLLGSGETRLNPEACDLRTLAQEAADTLALQAEHLGGTLSLEAAPGDYRLTADRLHLLSVIFNLCDNALKYANGTPDVRLNLYAGAQSLTLVVADKGIGIAPEHQARIFEKFYRVPQGDVHNVKGYGLGLSYVAEIVRLHGGQITVQSKPGEGTTFTLTLPREPHGS